MSLKMITTDIDGTLVNNNKKITARTIATLRAARSRGIYVVLCTGRPLVGIREYLQELHLGALDDFVITYNGAQVLRAASQEVVVSNLLTGSDYYQLEQLTQSLGVKSQAVTPDGNLYVTSADISPVSVMDSYFTKMPLHYRPQVELDHAPSLAKYMWADQPAILDAASLKLPQSFKDRYYCVHSEEWFFEFMARQATKGQAMLSLAERLGIKPAEIMAIGDQDNDLTMITAAGMGVAMGNANQRVKQAAKFVTSDNEHDGLAVAVEKFSRYSE